MKTRQMIFAALSVAGIILMTAACNKDEDPTLDFNITVPSSWRYYILGEKDVVYYAQSPQTTTTDSVAEDLVITKNDAKGMSLSAFYSAYVGSIADSDTTFEPETAIDTTINGEEAIQLIHFQTIYAVNTSNGDTVHLDAKIEKYFMMNNNYGYVVSFNALRTTFDDFKEVFDDIIASFSFKD